MNFCEFDEELSCVRDVDEEGEALDLSVAIKTLSPTSQEGAKRWSSN